MRRRSKSNKIVLELFPFLSVLACTIGSLILLIIVVSTETLNDNPEVTIIARSEGGENQKKQPRYIECKEDGIVIYPSQEFVSKNEMSQPNSPLTKFINEVKKNKDKEYIIVAVRPSGIEVFDTLRDIIMEEEIDIGYEPIEEDWTLKFE